MPRKKEEPKEKSGADIIADEVNKLPLGDDSPEESGIEFVEEDTVSREQLDSVLEQLAALQAQMKEMSERALEVPKHKEQVIVHHSDTKDDKFGSGVKREIPPEDRLSKPVTFLMRGRGLILSVYMKQGSEIYAPYNRPIRFVHTSSDIRRGGLAEDTLHFSTFSTWSAKEADFVRESPYYNTLIFESITKAMNYDPKLTSAIEQATSHVSAMTDDMVLSNAVSHGVDKSLPITDIKKILTNFKIQEVLEQEDYFEKKAQQTMKEIGVQQ